VRPSPAVPEWERIVQEMQLVAERIVRGRMPVPQALQALNARTDAMLEKRRWLLDRGAS